MTSDSADALAKVTEILPVIKKIASLQKSALVTAFTAMLDADTCSSVLLDLAAETFAYVSIVKPLPNARKLLESYVKAVSLLLTENDELGKLLDDSEKDLEAVRASKEVITISDNEESEEKTKKLTEKYTNLKDHYFRAKEKLKNQKIAIESFEAEKKALKERVQRKEMADKSEQTSSPSVPEAKKRRQVDSATQSENHPNGEILHLYRKVSRLENDLNSARSLHMEHIQKCQGNAQMQPVQQSQKRVIQSQHAGQPPVKRTLLQRDQPMPPNMVPFLVQTAPLQYHFQQMPAAQGQSVQWQQHPNVHVANRNAPK